MADRICENVRIWLTDLGHQPVVPENIPRLINFQGYVAITTEDRVVFVVEDEKYVSRSAEFKKLHAKAAPLAMIIVSKAPFKSAVAALAEREGVRYLPRLRFVRDVRRGCLVPPHSICTQEEVDELLATNFTTLKNMPPIHPDDAQYIWLDAKPGQVIKSERPGGLLYYRVAK